MESGRCVVLQAKRIAIPLRHIAVLFRSTRPTIWVPSLAASSPPLDRIRSYSPGIPSSDIPRVTVNTMGN